ncbi:MAG: HAMP domain-containing protein [Candidatus Hydrogenedentes bacterium]|nr:HAMP domain-containing protein [Candidatus Hydrogenedentota bacterium]
MLKIQGKLMLGFAGLLLMVGGIGMLTMQQIHYLGQAIDVILRENYRSVIACQDMKESLERVDSGLLFSLLGYEEESRECVEPNLKKFEEALRVELGNVTLPNEQEKAARIQALFERYQSAMTQVTNTTLDPRSRSDAYRHVLLPTFTGIKTLAQQILEMNQQNMKEANERARRLAVSAHGRIVAAVGACAVLAVLLIVFVRHWILKPIHTLIASANEIQRGNLDLVLENGSRDEVGQLSGAFNAMAESLRSTRRSDRMELQRMRRAAEDVFTALPAAAAVMDLDGRIEISTDTAVRYFGMRPGALIREMNLDWLPPLVERALTERRLVEYVGQGGAVQQFIENKEYFFRPVAIPIPVGTGAEEPTGAAVLLRDVTQAYEQRELKRDAVATVSHQLRTPLTSLRMSIHLLLNEKIGTLNEKQTELLLAARDDSERLVNMVEDLLDINRIESGHAMIDACAVSPLTLAREAIETFNAEAKDKGIALALRVPPDIPEVRADPARIRHVFANLLTNALRYTTAGGTITVEAVQEADKVRFLVQDTGAGIPAEHGSHVFEQFYRAPGQEGSSGAGLGLAIVKQIVVAHGGEAGVDSEPGHGSAFWFTLPLVAEAAPCANEESEEW